MLPEVGLSGSRFLVLPGLLLRLGWARPTAGAWPVALVDLLLGQALYWGWVTLSVPQTRRFGSLAMGPLA